MFQFPWSASIHLCIQCYGTWLLHHVGFPIRTSPDQCLLTAPRGSFVVRHVLRRLLAPRHPPCALYNLTRARCIRHFVPPFALAVIFMTSSSKPKSLHAEHISLCALKNFGCVTSFRYPVFKEQESEGLRPQNRT